MYDEPEEQNNERTIDPKQRTAEKVAELCTHAELAAIFEGNRKFEAAIDVRFDRDLAREIQRDVGKLEKAKSPEIPLLPPTATDEAVALMTLVKERGVSANDYHIARRPGEVTIVRWLGGEAVETFYQRLAAHFAFSLEGTREDERQANEWKNDPGTLAYLDALDAVKFDTALWYLREPIDTLGLFALSTQTADEINIAFLCDQIMGVPAEEIVGVASAPKDPTDEGELAWYFKLFSLRGTVDGEPRMLFFTYLQKAVDDFD